MVLKEPLNSSMEKSKQSGIYGVNLRINLLPFVTNGLSADSLTEPVSLHKDQTAAQNERTRKVGQVERELEPGPIKSSTFR